MTWRRRGRWRRCSASWPRRPTTWSTYSKSPRAQAAPVPPHPPTPAKKPSSRATRTSSRSCPPPTTSPRTASTSTGSRGRRTSRPSSWAARTPTTSRSWAPLRTRRPPWCEVDLRARREGLVGSEDTRDYGTGAFPTRRSVRCTMTAPLRYAPSRDRRAASSPLAGPRPPPSPPSFPLISDGAQSHTKRRVSWSPFCVLPLFFLLIFHLTCVGQRRKSSIGKKRTSTQLTLGHA